MRQLSLQRLYFTPLNDIAVYNNSMNPEQFSQFLIITGLIFIAIEIIIGAISGFDLLLIGVTLIIGGIFSQLTSSIEIGLITTILLSGLYIAIGRNMVKKMLAFKTKTTNIDSVLGKRAVVVKDIAKHSAGQIKLNGEVWRANASSDILKGTVVMIQSVEGITLKVEEETKI